MSEDTTPATVTIPQEAKVYELPSTKDIAVFGLLLVLIINLVSGWVFKKGSALNAPIATVSLESMISQTNGYFREKGQSNERASLNVAYFMPYIQDELRTVSLTGEYALVLDSKGVFFNTQTDITSLILARAMSEAEKDLTLSGNLPGRQANAER